MKSEIVYLGHDNSIDLLLMADGIAQNLGSASKMTLTFGSKLIESTNQDTDPIRWSKAGYQTGEIRLFLGDQEISAADDTYLVPLIVYDVGYPEGIVWGMILINVVAEVEAETEI